MTVIGRGEVSAAPDTLAATVGVSITARHVSDAMSGANVKARAVIDAVIAAGVSRSDVRTSELSLRPEYMHPGDGPARITGYTADNSVRITIRDLAKASNILDRAVTAGGDAARLSGVSFEVSDCTDLLTTARTRAFADARARAEQYAGLSDAALGAVLRIDETAAGPRPAARQEFALRAAAAPIEPGQQTISAEVTVVWELR